jgi:hypothetical protein
VPLELSTGDLVLCQVSGNITMHKTKELADTDIVGGLTTAQVGLNVTAIGSKEWAD